MRRKIAAVELHALDHFDGRLVRATFLDGDDTVFADFAEGIRQNATNRGIVVSGDRGDLLEALLIFDVDRFGQLADVFRDCVDRLGNAAAQPHRVGAGGQHLQSFAEDPFGQYGGGSGAVARDVVSFAGGFLHKLGAEILKGVFQFDVFGDGHTVFGHFGRTPTFVQHGVATSGTQGATHGSCEFLHPGCQRHAGIFLKYYLFGHVRLLFRLTGMCVIGGTGGVGLRAVGTRHQRFWQIDDDVKDLKSKERANVGKAAEKGGVFPVFAVKTWSDCLLWTKAEEIAGCHFGSSGRFQSLLRVSGNRNVPVRVLAAGGSLRL